MERRWLKTMLGQVSPWRKLQRFLRRPRSCGYRHLPGWSGYWILYNLHVIFMACSIFMLSYLILICCVIAGHRRQLFGQRRQEELRQLVATLSRCTFLPINRQIYVYGTIDATNPKHHHVGLLNFLELEWRQFIQKWVDRIETQGRSVKKLTQ